MLIYFGYSHCPDVCPISLGVIADAVEKLGAEGLARRARSSSPSIRRAIRRRCSSNIWPSFSPKLIGLTGSDKKIRQVVKEYRVYVAKHADCRAAIIRVDHSNIIYLMGPDGRFVADYDERSGPMDWRRRCGSIFNDFTQRRGARRFSVVNARGSAILWRALRADCSATSRLRVLNVWAGILQSPQPRSACCASGKRWSWRRRRRERA